ncbi:MAG TPA: isoprenyl transferase [Candidatus Hydrogenedentes bacterium]|nr:isoprenyl transferase [Candidatus Hydrogenedentota bacterium]HOS01852.1 isoprenyl transferase [Candidatus Hydrogenedentota bacterium]
MRVPELDQSRLPRHIGIIMDGNGRWAERHGVTRAAGHEAGAQSVRAAVEACRELGGVKVLSLYAFSTENWRRSKLEINALFRLLSKYISIEVADLHKENIRLTLMGRIEGLPQRAADDLRRSIELTANNTAMTLNLAINYGGRAEIADAARRIAADVAAGRLHPDHVDEACFAQRLYLPDLPDVDLLIRTSGEMRISNFMLWQVSYAEMVVTEVLWPDFRKKHLREAIAIYQSRNRRFGGR